MMKNAYSAFRGIETQLHALGEQHVLVPEVDAFLHGCIYLCMGALRWTLVFTLPPWNELGVRFC